MKRLEVGKTKVKILAKPCFYFGRIGIINKDDGSEYLLRYGVFIGGKEQFFARQELAIVGEQNEQQS